ncbi:MAG TPA: DUF4268 domain-containing protein [Flavobacteriaceae bacterium]|nr:DUF4268 domain-containing protein [Flavobacteriaceae bacterium]
MFSKEEAAQLRKLFWISFGKSFPRKWILYNTKIKGFSFKFVADRKKAMVALDIASNDEIKNELLFEQLLSLKTVLQENYLKNVIFDKNYTLENGKNISRIYVNYENKFSIYNKETWGNVFLFFKETMHQFELFYLEFEDYIKQAIY